MKFARYTHVDGKFRQELYQLDNDAVNAETNGIFHWLYPEHGITFEQLLQEIKKDETNWPEGHPEPQQVALWLVRSLEYDLARVVK